MNKIELFEKYRKQIPFVYTEDKGFRASIKQVLDEYSDDFNNLDDEPYCHSKSDIGIYINGIKNIIDLSYQGTHSVAFSLFVDLMDSHELSHNLKKRISNDVFFYRMRVFENRTSVSRENMFHIPLDKRGIITTQRYSYPGYPCLYLGTSINACWEELHRPSLDKCMVSALQLVRNVKFIDLSLPNMQKVKDEPLNLERFIMSYPLILACSVKVSNYLNSYKPEYIVPQLLMEYIIYKNSKEELFNKFIFGIKYTSVHINNDFNFPDDKFENWAIPVLEPLSDSKYCPILSEFFKITNPTCEEFERVKEGSVTYVNNEISSEYEKSIFYKLESKLRKRELCKIQIE